VRVAVCAPQVPFVRGGAELMAGSLVGAEGTTPNW
jgi:hypothetical protein